MTILDDQREWDELLAHIPLDVTTSDASRRLAALLKDAVQAHRPWAQEKLHEALIAGLGKQWKSHVQAQRPKIRTADGSTVKAVGGAKRRVQGNVIHVQLPYDLMSFPELAEHREMEASNGRSLAENVKAQDRLLALGEKVPTAATPAEACAQLGLDPADVMAGAA